VRKYSRTLRGIEQNRTVGLIRIWENRTEHDSTKQQGQKTTTTEQGGQNRTKQNRTEQFKIKTDQNRTAESSTKEIV
jgi:hypothetical protein